MKKELELEYKALCLAISCIDANAHFFNDGEGHRFHYLKIEPIYFNHIYTGKKKFEIRKRDRDFQTGDFLILREFESGSTTENFLVVRVSYLSDYIPEFCVMQFNEVWVACVSGCMEGLARYVA